MIDNWLQILLQLDARTLLTALLLVIAILWLIMGQGKAVAAAKVANRRPVGRVKVKPSQLTRVQKNDHGMMLQRASFLLVAGELDEAEKILASVLNKQADSTEATRSLLRLYGHENDRERFERIAGQAKQTFKDNPDMLTKIVQLRSRYFPSATESSSQSASGQSSQSKSVSDRVLVKRAKADQTTLAETGNAQPETAPTKQKTTQNKPAKPTKRRVDSGFSVSVEFQENKSPQGQFVYNELQDDALYLDAIRVGGKRIELLNKDERSKDDHSNANDNKERAKTGLAEKQEADDLTLEAEPTVRIRNLVEEMPSAEKSAASPVANAQTASADLPRESPIADAGTIYLNETRIEFARHMLSTGNVSGAKRLYEKIMKTNDQKGKRAVERLFAEQSVEEE